MSQTEASKPNRWIIWLLPVVIIAVALATFNYLKSTKPKPPARPVKEKVWTVQAETVRFTSEQPELSLYGKIESPRMASLTSALTAFVAQLEVDEGGQVEAGQLLIQLDPRDAQLILNQRQADLDNVNARISAEQVRHQSDLDSLTLEKNLVELQRKTVQRYQNLAKRKVGSEDQLDNARIAYQQQRLSLQSRQQAITDHPNRMAQLEADKARVEALRDAAKLDLERTGIRAPFIARIARVEVTPGDRVRSGDPLLSLYPLDRLEIRAQIPDRVLPLIRKALQQQQKITAAGHLDGQTLELGLDRLAAEVNSGRGGVDALFKITSGEIPEPGRSVAINLHLPMVKGVVSLAPQALYGTDSVYRIRNGRLEAIQVHQAGSKTDEGSPRVLLISDQLSEGDKVITTQLPNAISGLKVKQANQEISDAK